MAEREGTANRYSVGRSDRSKKLKLNEAIENRKQPLTFQSLEGLCHSLKGRHVLFLEGADNGTA